MQFLSKKKKSYAMSVINTHHPLFFPQDNYVSIKNIYFKNYLAIPLVFKIPKKKKKDNNTLKYLLTHNTIYLEVHFKND